MALCLEGSCKFQPLKVSPNQQAVLGLQWPYEQKIDSLSVAMCVEQIHPTQGLGLHHGLQTLTTTPVRQAPTYSPEGEFSVMPVE